MTFPSRDPDAGEPRASFLDTAEMAAALGLAAAPTPPLEGQIALASAAVSQFIRDYCGRTFVRDTYVERFPPPESRPYTFLRNETFAPPIFLTETPVLEVRSAKSGSNAISVDNNALHQSIGRLHLRNGSGWPAGDAWLEVEYVGGYKQLPADLLMVYIEMVRKQLGVMGANLGSAAASSVPIKGVSIGNLRVDYAVSPPSDGSSGTSSPLTKAGIEPFTSVLDLYRVFRTRMATG
jgi:hypothetical protein